METEGKSNGTDVVKEGGDDRREGEGVFQKQSFTRWLDVLDCPNPNSTPHLQCSLEHFVCSACRDKLPGIEKACAVCSRPISDRCHGVERIVGSILLPCSYHTHGCIGVIPYHQKAEHEKSCPHAPCFCPVKGCCFTGMTSALVDHFTAQHMWPMTAFKYHEPFNVPVKVGVRILHGSGQDEDKDSDSDLFLLRVGSPDSPLHKVSLVRVQAHMQECTVACSVGFSWFRGQY
ncbi:hypothetical protein ACQ4PT_064461 [Festuca glaucescens]